MLATRTTTVTIEAAGSSGATAYGDSATSFSTQNTGVGAAVMEMSRKDEDPHQSSELVERRFIITIGGQYVVAEGDRLTDADGVKYRVDEVRRPQSIGGVSDNRLMCVRLG